MGTENILHLGKSARALPIFRADAPPLILLVDENRWTRHFWTSDLFHSGYEVDEAASCAEAWEELKSDRYDLLIAEGKMPDASGFKLMKELRAAKLMVPVILATGSVPTDGFAQDLMLIPAATLLKPCSTEALLRTVREVLLTSNPGPRQIETAVREMNKPPGANFSIQCL
jgi:DNA-binding response OmpR family regulator